MLRVRFSQQYVCERMAEAAARHRPSGDAKARGRFSTLAISVLVCQLSTDTPIDLTTLEVLWN
jgi:hypothetical protein